MSTSTTTEIERKYAVDDTIALPDLGAVPGVTSAEAAPAARLEAVYFDTAGRTLLAARVALRRRTGGHDAGWHVKLPAVQGRTEVHAPIDEADPDALPADLARALFSRVGGRPLEPIARIRTERRAVVVADVDGGRLEVVDDRVTATDLGAGVLRTWREWEAEQVGEPDPSAALLDRVHDALVGAGAAISTSPAKLAQALGGSASTAAPAPSTAGSALVGVLAPLAEQLHRAVTTLVLEGDPDGETVHGLRKTIRRLRSLLAADAVAGPGGRALRDALHGLGAPLGAARDPIVTAGIAESLLERVGSGAPGLDATRERLVTGPRDRLATATASVVDRLTGADAAEVYAALDAFLLPGGGPDGPEAEGRPVALERLARKAVRRAVRRSRRTGEDLEALHDARKASRRARFVVEGVVAAGLVKAGSRLDRLGSRAEAVQDALGDHRDLAMLRVTLGEESAGLTASGGSAFALGALDVHAEQRLHRLRRKAAKRIAALARRA